METLESRKSDNMTPVIADNRTIEKTQIEAADKIWWSGKNDTFHNISKVSACIVCST